MVRFIWAVAASTLIAWPSAAVAACVEIRTVTDLSNIRNNLAGSHCLANDIDASSVPNFPPIGTGFGQNLFFGTLDGRGHVIRKLTIDSSAGFVGLFGVLGEGSVVRDLGLVDANVTASNATPNAGRFVGILAGISRGTISRSHANGSVTASGGTCVGGLIGQQSVGPLTQSYSGATVTAGTGTVGGLAGCVSSGVTVSQSHATGTVQGGAASIVGGLIADSNGSTIAQSYATGPTSGGANSRVGGLIGDAGLGGGTVIKSHATGVVSGGNNSDVGGLVGFAQSFVSITHSFATGPVTGGLSGGALGGLVGRANDATVTQAHASGPVTGGLNSRIGGLVGVVETRSLIVESWAAGKLTNLFGRKGGLIGRVSDSPLVAGNLWDTQTSGDNTSAGGVGAAGRTTAQMQASVLTGFDPAVWSITPGASYPFLKVAGIDFDAPLAVTVFGNRIYTFLPISQLDPAQYLTPPAHADAASRATVFTMLARAIGVAKNVAELTDVAVDEFFWNDANQRTFFRGPVTEHATLGPFTAMAGADPIGDANVIGPLKARKVVAIRGRFTKEDGGIAQHFMLATLFTANRNGIVTALVADDPWTGQQVRIDPVTKTVVSPANFPLARFKVNGFQVITLN
jgi:hypothetical protein